MKYKTARWITLLLYAAAIVLFFVRAFGVAQVPATVGMFLFVIVGFYLNYKFLRGPKCGRVMKATMNPKKGCPFCSEALLNGIEKGE